MYTDILNTISGIAVYPIVSLGLFVAFFSGVIVWAVRADGARLDRLAAMPLDDDRGGDTLASAREADRRIL
jgi:cytochrome c oxidase cbb3-type subunit 4